jgi:low affinity Fe/Cu permease
MQNQFERLTTGCARFAGRPTMLLICCALALLGVIAFASGSDRFINGATLGISTLTLLLLPILHSTQTRDGAALQAKLDELIRSHETASNQLIGLERRPGHEIESMRPSDDTTPDVTSPDAAD